MAKNDQCDDCKNTKKDVHEYNNPYQEEHNNIESKVTLCNSCYYSRTLKI